MKASNEQAPASKEKCESIGSMMVCLHFLSNQARVMQAPELVRVIDRAIEDMMNIAVDAYRGHVGEAQGEEKKFSSGFIEDFCKVNDETVKFELLEIAYRQAQEQRKRA